jgi:hypothetical protein
VKTPAVQEVCVRLWEARERGELTPGAAWRYAREMALAQAKDIADHAGYSPVNDHRSLWAQELLVAAREERGRKPRSSERWEAVAEVLLGKAIPCGKDRAAGLELEREEASHAA